MIPMKDLPQWDDGEESANMFSHLIGMVLSFFGVLLFIIQDMKKHDTYRLIGNLVFGISMIILYSTSTLYHGIEKISWKRVFRYGDHISIYLLIAGSYTPFTLTVLRPTIGWVVLIVIWSIAAIGIFLKIMYFDGFNKLSLVFYIVMGWTVMFSIKKVVETVPPTGVYWLVAGGVYYTFGTFFFSRDDSIPFAHAIWHLFVLAGTCSHFVSTYYYL